MLEKGEIQRSSNDAQGRFVRGFSEAQKGIDLPGRTITGAASTINLDREGEVILPAAFKARAGRFLASNAPFGAAHMHRAGDGLPTQIGWVTAMVVEAERVRCTFKFAATDLADQWWMLASDPAGKGIAFSIGFIPIRYISGSAADIAKEMPDLKPVFAAAGLKDDSWVRVYTEIELVEISAVMAPSNRESLQELAAKFFGTGGAAGSQADIEKLAGALCAPVIKAVADLQTALSVEASTKADELRTFLTDQIDELKALLPDTYGGRSDEHIELQPIVDDAATAAGEGPKGKELIAIAGKVLAALGYSTGP